MAFGMMKYSFILILAIAIGGCTPAYNFQYDELNSSPARVCYSKYISGEPIGELCKYAIY